MASLWVTEYNSPGDMPVAKEPAVRTQVVSFTTTTQSAAFSDDTRCVRLIADADCHLLFGLNPTATTSGQKVISGQETWRQVKPGDKVAVVAA